MFVARIAGRRGDAPSTTRTCDLQLRRPGKWAVFVIAGPFTVLHTVFVPQEDIANWSELPISLHSLLVVQRGELDSYEDQYARRHRGPVKVGFEESADDVEIGEIEVWYIDGSRAADNALDIADVCDSLGQEEYECASARPLRP